MKPPIETITKEMGLSAFWSSFIQLKDHDAKGIEERVEALFDIAVTLERKQNEIIDRVNELYDNRK